MMSQHGRQTKRILTSALDPYHRLAMNYNGYIILSIIFGAFIGAFIFSWEALWEGPRSNTSAAEEPTVCCS